MMNKRFKKWIPTKEQLQQHKSLSIFGSIIYSSIFWQFDRISVRRAVSIGLLFAWVPVPFQMLLAAGVAVICRANLPISVALVWITNPITMPALFYVAYKLGAYILGIPPSSFSFELSMEWLKSLVTDKWEPFLLGCAILGVFSSIAGNIFLRVAWRYITAQNLRERRNKRKIKKELKKGIKK